MSINQAATWTPNSTAALHDIFPPAETVAVLPERQNDADFLSSLYAFNNDGEIRKFLQRHDQLSQHLVEAHQQIKKIFRENAVQVSLEYAHDSEENFEGLFAIVKTDLSPERALDLLDRLDDEWFLEHVSPEIGNWFAVKVRPQ
ncbi:hypothetical protein L0337_10125 [candidate division KSB1 bacterium]|nr:hypothetical protein [candidate division KSB1 bacterium]